MRFPFYKQLEQMDCGPSCLKMICNHYGKTVSINEIKKLAFTNREGVSMLHISEAAEALGFRTLGIKITYEQLKKEAPLPCIVHWNQNHFVVVYQVKGSTIYVADPAVGLLKYRWPEFKNCWISGNLKTEDKGIALVLDPSPVFYEKDESLTHRQSLLQLLSYLRNYKKYIVQLFIGLLFGSLIQLVLPFLTQSLVDVGIETQNLNFIFLVLAGQLVLFGGRMIVDFLRRWILLHLSTRLNISIVSDFLIKLLKLPLSFFDSRMIGDLFQRIEDHNRIERFLSSSSLSIFFSFFNFIIFASVLAIYNLSIFLVFLVFSTLYISYVFLFLKKRAMLDYKRFSQLSGNQTNIVQLIHGVTEIKLNNCETQKRWEWEKIQAKIFKLKVSSEKLAQFQEAGARALTSLRIL